MTDLKRTGKEINKIVLHLSIFYEYQQFFQHCICFSIQPPDYSDPWPRLARFTSFFLIMLFKYVQNNMLIPRVVSEKILKFQHQKELVVAAMFNFWIKWKKYVCWESPMDTNKNIFCSF
jgi:hypothetical protein